MTSKERLVATALALSPPPPEAAAAYAAKAEAMAEAVSGLLAARPDLDRLIGPGNLDMMRDNHRNHARFMASLFRAYDPEVLVETVLWVFRAYRSHGFFESYWPAQLDAWLRVMRRELSPEAFSAVRGVYDWLIVNIPAFVAATDASPGVGVAPAGH